MSPDFKKPIPVNVPILCNRRMISVSISVVSDVVVIGLWGSISFSIRTPTSVRYERRTTTKQIMTILNTDVSLDNISNGKVPLSVEIEQRLTPL